MKLVIVLVVCSIGVNLSATTEAGTDGSIAVAYWAQDEMVIAADSRGTIGNSYHDTECKVSALGNKLIFAATGRSSLGQDPGWDTYTLAKNIFRTLDAEGTTEGLASSLATVWGEEVKEEFEEIGDSALVGINDNYITTGIFGDFESNTLKVFMSEVTYKIGPDGHANITANVTPAEWKLPGGGGNRFIGEGGMWSVLGEMQSAKTSRGEKWNKAFLESARADDKLVAEATTMVRIVIEGSPPTRTDKNGVKFSTVGFPIAVVRLRRNKGTDWVAKGACCVLSEQKTQPHPKKPQPKMK